MDTIFEKQLSTEERNSLDTKEFGLPNERKYPLNDKKHVLSAIQYFRFCEKSKRLELAKNINKKLKDFDMTVKVNPNNPFYKYIDKKYLDSSVTESVISTNNHIKFSDGLNEYIEKIKNMPLETSDDIIEAENSLIPAYSLLSSRYDKDTAISFFKVISDLLDDWYDQYLNQIEYNGDRLTKFKGILVIDCIRSLYDKLLLNENITADNPELNVLRSIELGFLRYSVMRQLRCIRTKYESNDPDNAILYLINDLNYPEKSDNRSDINDIMFGVLCCSDMRLPNLEKYLEELKIQNENELYIINKYYTESRYEKSFKYIYHLNMIQDKGIKNKIEILERDLVNKDILNLPVYLSTRIPENEMIKMIMMDCMSYFVEGTFSDGSIVYYAVSGDTLFYIFKDKWKEDRFELLELDDDMINSLINPEENIPVIKMLQMSLVENHNTVNKVVNEGFVIDSDGNVTISINPKKSYMDQYSEAHRILVESHKNKNYETVKHGVSFMFTLISIIERDKKYKKRNPEAVKARAFAINDFKTYLKHINSVESDFDFFEFYRANNYDKLIIDIPFTTIVGLKKILKSIL